MRSSPTRTALAPWPVEAVRQIRGYYQGSGPSEEKMRALLESLVYDTSIISEDLVRSRYEASIQPEVVELFTKHPPVQEDFGAELDRVAAKTLIVWGPRTEPGPSRSVC